MSIKDVLTDLTNITKGPKFSVIKVSGTDKETEFKSMTDDNSVIMKAVTKTPIKDFEGVFGLGNLDVLRGYLSIYDSYSKDTNINLSMNHKEVNDLKIPSDILFKAKGQSSASYRLIGESAMKKIAVFKGNDKWDAELKDISKIKINEFSRFSGVLGGFEKKFTVKTKDDKLVFYIGQENAAISKVEIEMGEVSGSLKSAFSYPLSDYLTILQHHSPVLKFSDMGMAIVFIETDLVKYEFVFPGSNH